MPGLPHVALQDDQDDQEDQFDLVIGGLGTQGIVQLLLSVCMSVFPFRTPNLFVSCHLQPLMTESPNGGLCQGGIGLQSPICNLLALFSPFLG